jgi:hypothetical protein
VLYLTYKTVLEGGGTHEVYKVRWQRHVNDNRLIMSASSVGRRLRALHAGSLLQRMGCGLQEGSL